MASSHKMFRRIKTGNKCPRGLPRFEDRPKGAVNGKTSPMSEKTDNKGEKEENG